MEKKRSKFAIKQDQQIQRATKLNFGISEYTIYIGLGILFYKRCKDPKRHNNMKFENKIKYHTKKRFNF